MIDFAPVTAFHLLRRLALAQGARAMYLLIYAEGNRSAIEADLNAEFELHFGTPPPMTMVSAPPDHDGDFGLYEGGPIRVLWIDLWLTQLVPLLDTHVVRLERIGGQFLFLATPELAERLLVQAPNFRNRLTEIMRIVPDDLSGSVQH